MIFLEFGHFSSPILSTVIPEIPGLFTDIYGPIEVLTDHIVGNPYTFFFLTVYSFLFLFYCLAYMLNFYPKEMVQVYLKSVNL